MDKPTQNGNGHPVIEKMVRHTFTLDERNEIGGNLARSIASQRGIVAEFDQVKAGYKARTTEAEARVDSLSTAIMNGFEMRVKRCRVVYKPKERKKHFYLDGEEADEASTLPVLIEDMTPDDFQADLIQAESIFENRMELPLFIPLDESRGVLVVGQLKGRWFTALRMRIGRASIEERLDSEQRGSKERADAIHLGAKRAMTWITETMGKEKAEGFKQGILDMVEAQKEKVE